MKVAFYKSKRHIWNRVVSWWMGGPYSHCEIILDDGDDGYTFLCASASGPDGGVRFKRMPLLADTWDIVDVPADFHKVYSWFQQHLGAKYDYLGLFGFVGRRGTQDQSKWFCSEACAAALGYDVPWRYDPNSLYTTLKGNRYV